MRLAAKFNIVLGVVFTVGVVVTTGSLYYVLKGNAESEVLYRAGLMMQSASAVRSYTVNEIRPLLAQHMADEFLPQTVPAYAATQAFENLRETSPDYTYKEATLNPTNPRDRAVAWEADIVEQFSNHDGLTEIIGERDTPSGSSLYLARPIRITNPGCLVCHSTPDQAPPSLIKKYGDSNGFGWQLNEVVGAQIVSVPTALPREKALQVFTIVLGLIVAGFAVVAISTNVLLRRIVVTPATTMAKMADEVSRGQMGSDAFREDGNDEISELAKSFNRMRRSLEKAIKLLD
jgi:HAMP domain-containing protein